MTGRTSFEMRRGSLVYREPHRSTKDCYHNFAAPTLAALGASWKWNITSLLYSMLSMHRCET